MKKTLAFLITLAMAISMFAMTASATFADQFHYPVAYDFEDFTAGSYSADYLAVQTMGGNQIVDLGDDHGKVMAYPTGNSSEYILMVNQSKSDDSAGWKGLPAKFTISLDLKLAKPDTDASDYYFQFVPQTLSGTVKENGDFLILGTDGSVWSPLKLGYFAGVGGAGTFPLDQWNNLKIKFDTESNRAEVYINGNLLVEGSPFTDDADERVFHRFIFNWRNGSWTGSSAWLDNFEIYEGWEDKTPDVGEGEGEGEGSPETADFLSVAIAVASISLAGVVVAKKRR